MSAERIVGMPIGRSMVQFVGVVNITDEPFEVMIGGVTEIFEPGEVTDPRTMCIKRCLPQAAADFMKHGHQFLRQMDDDERLVLLNRSKEVGFFAALKEETGAVPFSPVAAQKKEQRRQQLLAQLRKRGHKLEDDESMEVLEAHLTEGVVPMLKLKKKEEREAFVEQEKAAEEIGESAEDKAREAAEMKEQIEKAKVRAQIKTLTGKAAPPNAGLTKLNELLAEAKAGAKAAG